MPERTKVHPPYAFTWNGEPVNVLQIQPPASLSHDDANLMCGACKYHRSPDNTNIGCLGFQYGGGSMKSATISSKEPLGKTEWAVLLDSANCSPKI